MPGTIQVSVVDFVDLPSSLPSSSISIKVSMGKREYQAWEKGDFSFPLLNLREILIVTLYDAEGNKISDTGVEAISVVEKGCWDDYFPLEVGGHVHMKMQFTLSEEERNRIRMMRESASKKKHSELLNSSPQRPETAANTAVSSLNREFSAASTAEVATQAIMVSNPVSFCTDPQSGTGIKEGTHVVQGQTKTNDTDTREATSSTAPVPQGIEVHRTEVYSQGSVKGTKTQSPSVDGSMFPKEVSTLVGSSNTNEATLSTAPMPQGIEVHSTEVYCPGSITQLPSVDGSMHPKEVSTLVGSSDTSEVTSSTAAVPQVIEVHRNEVYFPGSVKVTETQSPSVDESMNPKEVLSRVRSSQMLVSAKNKSLPPRQEEDQANNTDKQGPLERTPSNVWKMISAFERPRAQDTKSDYKSITIKTPSSKLRVEAPLKDSYTKEVKTDLTKPTQASSVKVANPFLKEEPQQKKRGEKLNHEGALDGSKSSQHDGQLKELCNEQIQFKGMNSSLKDVRKAHNKAAKEEEKESPDLMRVSTVEEATVSGQMIDEHLVRQQPTNSLQIQSKSTNSRLKDDGIAHSKLDKTKEKEFPDLSRVSTVEEATVSGQMLDEYLVRQQPTNSLSDSRDSGGTSAMMESAREIHIKDSHMTNLQRDSNDTMKSLYHVDKQNLRNSSSTWIFPEEARQICVTTAYSAEATTHRGRMSFSAPQHVEEHSLHGEKTFCTPRESKLKNSAEVQNRVGQAIKVAIMVGFGTLVLFTRQRKNS